MRRIDYMRLGIDIDSTIRQFAEDCIYKYNLQHQLNNSNEPIMTLEDWCDYDYFYRVMGGRKQAHQWWIDNDVFLNAPVMKMARESLLELHTMGHEIIIISKQTRDNHPEAARQTTQWLYNNEIYYDELHYCTNKNVVDIDVIIDDNPRIIDSFLQFHKGNNKKLAVLLVYPWSNQMKWDGCYPLLRHVHKPYWEDIMNIIKDYGRNK